MLPPQRKRARKEGRPRVDCKLCHLPLVPRVPELPAPLSRRLCLCQCLVLRQQATLSFSGSPLPGAHFRKLACYTLDSLSSCSSRITFDLCKNVFLHSAHAYAESPGSMVVALLASRCPHPSIARIIIIVMCHSQPLLLCSIECVVPGSKPINTSPWFEHS